MVQFLERIKTNSVRLEHLNSSFLERESCTSFEHWTIGGADGLLTCQPARRKVSSTREA